MAHANISDLYAIDFCNELGQDPSLRVVRDAETKVSHLLVYGYRYRECGACGNPVRASTVRNKIGNICKEITELGVKDPRREDRHVHPLVTAFIDALTDEGDPQTRTYPAKVTIIEQLFDTLDTDHLSHGQCNRHVINIIVLAFLKKKYLKPRGEDAKHSTPFCLCDVHFAINGRQYVATDPSLNDVNLSAMTHVTLTFTDQKNAVRGERIGHTVSGDARLCPVVAAFHI